MTHRNPRMRPCMPEQDQVCAHNEHVFEPEQVHCWQVQPRPGILMGHHSRESCKRKLLCERMRRLRVHPARRVVIELHRPSVHCPGNRAVKAIPELVERGYVVCRRKLCLNVCRVDLLPSQVGAIDIARDPARARQQERAARAERSVCGHDALHMHFASSSNNALLPLL